MTKFIPKFETIRVEPEPRPAEVHFDAVTNLPAEGTRVHATLQGVFDVTGKVKYAWAEYGVLILKHEVWRDGHYKGYAEIRIEVKLGWEIEILEDE